MLSRFEYHLQSEQPLSIHMSSLFHGALMELVDEDFASRVHEQSLHPYSQHLEKRDGEWYWIINSLSEEADGVIRNALQDKKGFHFLKHDMDVSIEKCKEQQCSEADMKELFYRADHDGCFRLRFQTSTAFKRRGEYLIFPDLFCIYQSLMNRYDSVIDRHSKRSFLQNRHNSI